MRNLGHQILGGRNLRKQPHIIIFNPDEMRWNTMGHMGNPAAVTPFLDEFAAREGVSFSNAFCQNTVCVPSRCSFFTGLYPHVNGHRTMSHLLHPGESNLFSALSKFSLLLFVAAKCNVAIAPVSFLFASSGNGEYISPVLSPASTCPIGF